MYYYNFYKYRRLEYYFFCAPNASNFDFKLCVSPLVIVANGLGPSLGDGFEVVVEEELDEAVELEELVVVVEGLAGFGAGVADVVFVGGVVVVVGAGVVLGLGVVEGVTDLVVVEGVVDFTGAEVVAEDVADFVGAEVVVADFVGAEVVVEGVVDFTGAEVVVEDVADFV